MIATVRSETGHEVPAFIDPTGVPRALGRILTDTPKMAFASFTRAFPTIRLTDIQPYDRWQKNIPILDQGQVGSCTAHSIVTAIEKARDLAGYTYVPLSPCSLYAQINRDMDQGSNPSDGIAAISYPKGHGICRLADQANVFVQWDSISEAAKENALRFRIMPEAAFKLENFEEMVIADYLGFGVILTVHVGNNFNPGSNGLVGFSPGVGNHCIAGGEGYKIINGRPAYRFRNSWTTSWGIGGCGWITPEYIDQQPQKEVIAIKWAIVDPLDQNQPPVGVV